MSCKYEATGDYVCEPIIRSESFNNVEHFNAEYAFMPTLGGPGGNDIMNDGANRDKIDGLKATCDTLPTCKGFNSNGWMKNTIPPKNQWNSPEASFLDKPDTKGFYLKKSDDDPTYTFIPGVAGPGGFDVLDNRMDADNVENLMATCNLDPNCDGFNTNGWMKGKLPTQDSWDTTMEPSFQDDQNKGFYVKNK